MNSGLDFVDRDNLTQRVYLELRSALMEGKFWPGHRFKIKELARILDVSDTPVREAMMKLVCEKGLEMRAGRSITVAELSLAQYLELRRIRLHLEAMAGEAAAEHITPEDITRLSALHRELVEAEDSGRWAQAVRANWDFHHTIYRAANMPELLWIIEGIWLRNGPLVNYQYPYARPSYDGRHRHHDIIDALSRREGVAVREGIQADLLEGGRYLIQLLERIESGEVDKASLRRDADTRTEGPAAGFG